MVNLCGLLLNMFDGKGLMLLIAATDSSELNQDKWAKY